MKLDVSQKILIVGLGLIGGSYAKGFKKAGHTVFAVDVSEETIAYAVENGIIDFGDTHAKEELLSQADIVIFALYPHNFDIDILYTELDKERIEKFHKNGIKVNCWTCDDKERAEELVKYGIDYITSNILE